jgi:hypothetical protein
LWKGGQKIEKCLMATVIEVVKVLTLDIRDRAIRV